MSRNLPAALLLLTLPAALPAQAPPKLKIAEIQGRGHQSPWAGQRVATAGVITALDGQRLFLQDPEPDGDPATSEALIVTLPAPMEGLVSGQPLELVGRVEEIRRERDLSVTTLVAERVEALAIGPKIVPVRLDLLPSEVIDDDGLTRFDPQSDGLDFFESLEGMSVALEEPIVIGPWTEWEELVVLANDGRAASRRSRRDGLLLRPGDDNPERLFVSGRLIGKLPRVGVGQRLAGPVVGVVAYENSRFQVLATQEFAALAGKAAVAERSAWTSLPDHLRIATFNVENLSGRDQAPRFDAIARIIVESLAAPEIVALQEIQDNNGDRARDQAPDTVVAADQTVAALLQAILRVGGPMYQARWVDPPPGDPDGGAPGGNIRPVLLFRDNVKSVDRATNLENPGVFGHAEQIVATESPARLLASPIRYDHSAFNVDQARLYKASRKPLIAQFRFAGHDLFVINAHFASKRGDSSAFGSEQPPRFVTEEQRSAQARAVREVAATLLKRDPQARIVVLGDLNENEFRPPMRVLAGSLLRDLIDEVAADDRYTFNYQGNSQVLDHVFISRELWENARPEIDIVHVNADFPADSRASDHDPVVVRLWLP